MVGNVPSKIPVEAAQRRGVSLEEAPCYQAAREDAGGSCWPLVSQRCRILVLEKLPVLQDRAHQSQETKLSSYSVCPTPSTHKASVPAGKGKNMLLAQIHFFFFTDQSKRMNLELRGNKSVSSTVHPTFDCSPSIYTLLHTFEVQYNGKTTLYLYLTRYSVRS